MWLPEIIFTMFFCLYVTVHLLVLLSNIISKQFRKKLFSKEGTHRICCIFCINKERNHKKKQLRFTQAIEIGASFSLSAYEMKNNCRLFDRLFKKHFPFWNIFFRFRDIDVFLLCKLGK